MSSAWHRFFASACQERERALACRHCRHSFFTRLSSASLLALAIYSFTSLLPCHQLFRALAFACRHCRHRPVSLPCIAKQKNQCEAKRKLNIRAQSTKKETGYPGTEKTEYTSTKKKTENTKLNIRAKSCVLTACMSTRAPFFSDN
jgi:hypothetical protein